MGSEYDPETERQSAEWHNGASPRPKKARMSKSWVETLLIVFLILRESSTRGVCASGTDGKRSFFTRESSIV